MTFDYSVEVHYKKFCNLSCSNSFTDSQLVIIKKYMQYCYESGHAQGYADRIYDESNSCK